MRRDVKILLATAGLGAVSVWGPSASAAIRELETFLVADVRVEGARYLSEEEVRSLLGVTSQTSVWGDLGVWADRVAAHPLVRTATVTRRLPDGLVVEVTERTPIALAPTPALEPIDAEGYRLPLDPTEYRLDLPVLVASGRPPAGASLVPDDVRRLAGEVSQLMASDTAFLQRVSTATWTERGSVIVSWTEPRVDFVLPPGTSAARLREGLLALTDAATRTPDRVPTLVDLRFADQVVVRRAEDGGA